MSCNKCNLSKCGCQDSYLTTPPPCPVPSDCPEVQPCSESFNAECIVYTGLPITCGLVEVVSTNSSVSDALASITSFLCDEVTVDNDILCNLDVIVPADTLVEDALVLIVAYFCTAIDNILPQGLFTAIADAVVSNTTSFTNFVGSGVGSMTIPANSLSVGDTFRLKVHVERTVGFATDTEIQVQFGGITLATHSSTGGNDFVLEAEIVVRSIGATGSVQYGGVLDNIGTGLNTTSVVDTTNFLGTLFAVRARFVVADPGNFVTSKILSLTKIF